MVSKEWREACPVRGQTMPHTCLPRARPSPGTFLGTHTQGPPGCLQVNWSQPPWLVNNHREPQRQWHRGGPAWLRGEGGWTPRPTATTSAPARVWGGSQSHGGAHSQDGGPYPGEGGGLWLSLGRPSGHYPVAMAPSCH